MEERQRILGHGAIVARPLDRVLERGMTADQAHRMLEVALGDLARFEGAAPEFPVRLAAAAKRQDDGERDLPLPEIVADILAEPRLGPAIVERVVDELEGDPEIHAEGTACGLLV